MFDDDRNDDEGDEVHDCISLGVDKTIRWMLRGIRLSIFHGLRFI